MGQTHHVRDLHVHDHRDHLLYVHHRHDRDRRDHLPYVHLPCDHLHRDRDHRDHLLFLHGHRDHLLCGHDRHVLQKYFRRLAATLKLLIRYWRTLNASDGSNGPEYAVSNEGFCRSGCRPR